MNFDEGKAARFPSPTALPWDDTEHGEWQRANRRWWEANPMRYDWNAPVTAAPGTRAWFEEIDRRSFASHIVPQGREPFDGLIPYGDLNGRDVLEIGVGMGSHAQILARRARRFVGVDMTTAAVQATRQRFKVFGLRGSVLQMDGERLAFPSHSFDLVWSWGVIHHSANTRRILEEIRRVLRATGEARIMVYHKAFVPWYVYDGFLRGVLQGRRWKYGSTASVVQSITDGALARYYTRHAWSEVTRGLFQVKELGVYGNRGEALPIPAGRLKERLTAAIPRRWFSFFLTQLRQGRLLYSRLQPVQE